jgi:hypothetical protein
MSERCEKCGKVVTFEKHEEGLEVVDVGYDELHNVCPECAQDQRTSDAAHLEDGGEG